MGVSVTLSGEAAPSIADAHRAAKALVDEGAEEVFLYGSVAHGDPGPLSDIDLVALFADIDYRDRYQLTRRLEKAASEAIARRWPVQVFATDRPEWKARIERVPSSFEHRINALGLIPVGESALRGEVRWDKAMVRPMSDLEEALKTFDSDILDELRGMATFTVAYTLESAPDYPFELQEGARLGRMVDVCSKAAMVIEKTIKNLAIWHSDPKPTAADRRRAGHDISACLELLPPGLRSEITDRLGEGNIDLATMSSWRVYGTYPDNVEVLRDTADRLAQRYVTAAVELAGILYSDLAAASVPGNDTLKTVTTKWNKLTSEIASQDVRTGRTRKLDLPSLDL